MRFKYEGLDAIDRIKAGERETGYYHFMVTDSDSGDIILNFYTNGCLKGKWYYDERTCNYRQVEGTCLFSLTTKSKNALRMQLRKLAMKELCE